MTDYEIFQIFEDFKFFLKLIKNELNLTINIKKIKTELYSLWHNKMSMKIVAV